MANISKDRLYDIMRKQELVMFRVTDQGRRIDDSDDPDMKIDEAVTRLQETLDEMQGNFVDVTLSKHTKAQKQKGGAAIRDDFSYRVALGGIIGTGSGAAPDMKKVMDENYDLKLKIERMEFEKKLDKMERSFNDRLDLMEEEKDSGLAGILKPHAPILIPAIISALTGKQVPLASPGLAGTEESDDDKIDNAIDRLLAVDNDFPNTITRLADYAEKNPEGYRSALGLLIQAS